MASVKCIARHAISLPDGRLLPPGVTADDVDLTTPEALAQLAAGQLVALNNFDPTGRTVGEVLDWVGDDPERAAVALASERARPGREQRSTLTDKLEELVGNPDSSEEE